MNIYKEARVAGREGKNEEALEMYEKILKPYVKHFGDASSELADLYYRLGRVYLALGKKVRFSYWLCGIILLLFSLCCNNCRLP